LTNLCYLKAIADRCTQVGALLVFDEIQTGFGRTGPFWAHERYGLAPDILLSAKGMGGGMPIGAFMAPQHIMEVLKDNPILGHITTFGGHPVSCAASLATLEVILEEINELETYRKGQRIRLILEKHPKVSEVRGVGLMMAAQMQNFEVLKSEIDVLIENRLITDWFLYCDDAMRICPPLNISDAEIDLFENIFLAKKA
jgi:acetylornithine/N-succinyldiaminopimelate aminotransferase